MKPFKVEINPIYTDKLQPPFDASQLPNLLEYAPNLAEIVTNSVNRLAHNHIRPGMLQQKHIDAAVSRKQVINKETGLIDTDKFWPWLWRWHYERTYELATVTASQLLDAVSMGYSFRPVYKNNWRKSDNFLEASHLCLDFDSGDVTLQDHALHPLAVSAASFAYTSPSHMKPGKGHRNRLVFITERPITNMSSYVRAVTALQEVYGFDLDVSGKDAARYWYGSAGCESWTPYNRITFDRIATIIERNKEKPGRAVIGSDVRIRRKNAGGLSPAQRAERILDSIIANFETRASGKHEYFRNTAKSVGGYIASQYLNETEAVEALKAAAAKNGNIEDMDNAFSVIDWGIAAGKKSPIVLEVN